MVLGGMDLGTTHEEWTSRGDSGDTDGQSQDRDLESEKVKVSNRKKSNLRSEGAGVQPRWIQGIRRVDGVGVERLVY